MPLQRSQMGLPPTQEYLTGKVWGLVVALQEKFIVRRK